MSDSMISALTNIIGVLAECDEDIDGVIVVNRDAVIEILRGIIQDELMSKGILKDVAE